METKIADNGHAFVTDEDRKRISHLVVEDIEAQGTDTSVKYQLDQIPKAKITAVVQEIMDEIELHGERGKPGQFSIPS